MAIRRVGGVLRSVLLVVVLRLLLLKLLQSLLELLVKVGIFDPEAKSNAAEGRVFDIPGSKTTMKLTRRVIKHVYPADSRCRRGTDYVVKSPLCAWGAKRGT